MSATVGNMRQFAWGTVIALVAVAAAFAVRQHPRVLLSRLGNFHVELPAGFPQPHRTRVQVGRLPVVTYASDSGQSAVVVRFVEYPVRPARVDVLLTQAQATSLHNIGARLLVSQRRRLDGHPARSALFVVGRSLFGRVDYLVAGRRLYQIEYVTPHRANINLASTRNYFDSFTLLR
ncbi:MAG: hypothetical protein ACYCW6_07875 [Candidatus Xenobia bacterium]